MVLAFFCTDGGNKMDGDFEVTMGFAPASKQTIGEEAVIFSDGDDIFSVHDIEVFLNDLDIIAAHTYIAMTGITGIGLRAGAVTIPDGEDLEAVLEALARGIEALEARLEELEAK